MRIVYGWTNLILWVLHHHLLLLRWLVHRDWVHLWRELTEVLNWIRRLLRLDGWSRLLHHWRNIQCLWWKGSTCGCITRVVNLHREDNQWHVFSTKPCMFALDLKEVRAFNRWWLIRVLQCSEPFLHLRDNMRFILLKTVQILVEQVDLR